MAEEGKEPEPGMERTKVRPGMKRELEFALKYQSQIEEYSGRTRASRARTLAVNNSPLAGGGRKSSRARRAGPASSDDSMTSDVDDGHVANHDGVQYRDVPTTVRELIQTGFLDGVNVKYIYRPKAIDLEGVIKEGGILCGCRACDGFKALTVTDFENHAGNGDKRRGEGRHLQAAKNIYLFNGISLLDVMIGCQEAPEEDTVEDIVRMAKFSSSLEEFNAMRRSEESDEESVQQHGFSYQTSFDMADSQPAAFVPPDFTHRSSRQPVVAESFVLAQNDSSSKIKSQGKITKKDQHQHQIVFRGVLKDGTVVAYFDKKEKVRTGHIEGAAIVCHCCYTHVSPSVFENHAGKGERRKPFHNIYLSNGVSLHQLAVNLLCTICGKGRDLLDCEACPRSFHRACMNPAYVPAAAGRQLCTKCTRFENEKSGHNAYAIAFSLDPIEQIINGGISVLNTLEVFDGGCVLCRSRDFESGFGPDTIMMCDQCERQYHVRCLKDHKMAYLKAKPEGDWFCSESCYTVRTMLQKAANRATDKLPDYLLDVIKMKQGGDPLDQVNVEVRWKLVSAKVKDAENKLLLSRVITLFQESFGPVADPKTGADLISAMVYGEKVDEHDFSGMHCAVLTLDSHPVSVGVIRIYGEELAQLPLVATKQKFRGQGYFKALIACIEMYLSFLHVKRIVLPAANGSESIWVEKYGFTRISEEEMGECVADFNVMPFQAVPWYRKSVPAHSFYRPPEEGTVGFSLFSQSRPQHLMLSVDC